MLICYWTWWVKFLRKIKWEFRRGAVRNLFVVCQWVWQRRFFHWWKNFYLNPPVNRQNDCVWSASKKRDVHESRLVVERSKFAKHVMVSAGVCYGGKGRLHFIPDKAKVNAQLYIETLLPRLIEDRLQVCSTVWFHFPAGRCACSHGEVDSRLYCHQL